MREPHTVSALEIARPELVRSALRLEKLSLGWMTIEAIVAIVAGIAAGSLTVTAFGLDSVIELGSAAVLMWRLSVEVRHGQAFPEAIEHRASRIAALLLFALAAYMLIAAGWRLWLRHGGEFSPPGLIIAALTIPVMYFLAQRKRAVAQQLSSRAMRADAAESTACLWLSFIVVLGQVAELAIGAWWVDPLASLAVLWFVVREAREAWSGDACC
jgi:divalent metal cation (Fe/Co/Zn/Cd) transporter